MDNKTIYKKTLGFSLRRLAWDILAFVIVAVCTSAGFLIVNSTTNMGLIGLVIGAIVGAIIAGIILHFFAYSNKAGQIAMMTKGVTEDKLPDDVIGEGKKIVKSRFATVAAYYAVTNAIKGIFRQIGRAITAVGNAVGGDSGSAVGGTISGIIDTVIAYLCDCCLGWVFYRKDIKATKATCEGAVLFFKHGKTLAKNLGRVFGISLLSFIAIGGVFFGISWLIFQTMPDTFSQLSAAIVESGAHGSANLPQFVSDPALLSAVCAGIIGVIFWGIIHSTFVRPFILVGVLRNYINSGINDIPTESAMKELDGKSQKFAKLHQELGK